MADQKRLRSFSKEISRENVGNPPLTHPFHGTIPPSEGDEVICRMDRPPKLTGSSSSCDDFVQVDVNECDPDGDSHTLQDDDLDCSLDFSSLDVASDSVNDSCIQKQGPTSISESVKKFDTSSVDSSPVSGSHATDPDKSDTTTRVGDPNNRTPRNVCMLKDGIKVKESPEVTNCLLLTGGRTDNLMKSSERTMPLNVDLGCEVDGSVASCLGTEGNDTISDSVNRDSWIELPPQVELGHMSLTDRCREGKHESFEDLASRTEKIRLMHHIPPSAYLMPSDSQKGNSDMVDPMSMSGFNSIETVSSLSSNTSDASLGSDSGLAAKDFQECRESQDQERLSHGMQLPSPRLFFRHIGNKPLKQAEKRSNIDSAGSGSRRQCHSPGDVTRHHSQRRYSSPGSPTSSDQTSPVHQLRVQNHPHHHHHRHGHKHRGQHHHSDKSFGAENLEQKFERETEKMKTKMMSMWNNMKYGWTLKTTTNFKYDSAIWLLGRLYHKRPDDEDEEEEEAWNPNLLKDEKRLPSMEQFKRAFASIIWFTYRREFPTLPGTKLTTDCGWGCMLRSCQMMVAQALVTHFLGTEWDMYKAQSRENWAFHRNIISWFGDMPSDKAPFSIHNLATIGQSLDKQPGDWYGPASAAHIFRTALTRGQTPIPLLDQLSIYVAQDCTMYKQDVLDASMGVDADLDDVTREGEEADAKLQWRRAVIVLIPVRLGGETINEMYVPCVQSILAHRHCLGIIGGKPRHSLYFLGWQDNKLVYLDPHFCQDSVDLTQPDFPIETYHCMSPRKLPFHKMDPSCTIGFYCRTQEDFNTLLSHVNDMVIPPKQKGQYPLFVVAEGRSTDVELAPTAEEGRLRIRRIRKDKDGRIRSMTTDSEDFIVLGQNL